MSKEPLGRGIEAGPDEALDRMRWTFMGALSAAKHSVRIWTPYFVPDQPMIAALSTAALRGVRIDVLTPANGDHPTVQWAARAHYWQVLEHGVRIFERPGPFDHSKLMLVDGRGAAWVRPIGMRAVCASTSSSMWRCTTPRCLRGCHPF